MANLTAVVSALLFLYLALGTAAGWPIHPAIGLATFPGRYVLIELGLSVPVIIAFRRLYVRHFKKSVPANHHADARKRKILTISGMSCGHCVMKVESEILDVPGVEDVDVDLLKGSAMVSGESLNDAALAAAVAKAGYRVTAILGSR